MECVQQAAAVGGVKAPAQTVGGVSDWREDVRRRAKRPRQTLAEEEAKSLRQKRGRLDYLGTDKGRGAFSLVDFLTALPPPPSPTFSPPKEEEQEEETAPPEKPSLRRPTRRRLVF
ncbi:uncharacterized protein LOC135199161 [Macrobrachium nipponense]|uniref:uncharacterized protein LOC135199161 n=1 Tax=Macrobrachium nipponense TaxID=159736 RepID=UPI0030C829C3